MKNDLLNNIEAFEEFGDVLIGWLPGKTSRSDHCIAVDHFILSAVRPMETFVELISWNEAYSAIIPYSGL